MADEPIFDAYEVLPSGRLKRRGDLPSFNSAEEVMNYLSNNPGASVRGKVFVPLEWRERTTNGNSSH